MIETVLRLAVITGAMAVLLWAVCGFKFGRDSDTDGNTSNKGLPQPRLETLRWLQVAVIAMLWAGLWFIGMAWAMGLT